MGFFDRFKVKKVEGVDDTMYLTLREERQITKENTKIIREFERQKNRKNVKEEEYLTQMKDPSNVVEFDNLHTYFFTEIVIFSFEYPRGIVGVVGESG